MWHQRCCHHHTFSYERWLLGLSSWTLWLYDFMIDGCISQCYVWYSWAGDLLWSWDLQWSDDHLLFKSFLSLSYSLSNCLSDQQILYSILTMQNISLMLITFSCLLSVTSYLPSLTCLLNFLSEVHDWAVHVMNAHSDVSFHRWWLCFVEISQEVKVSAIMYILYQLYACKSSVSALYQIYSCLWSMWQTFIFLSQALYLHSARSEAQYVLSDWIITVIAFIFNCTLNKT